jgi:hypothetical protein
MDKVENTCNKSAGVVFTPASRLKTETDSVSEASCFFFNVGRWTRSKNSTILIAIHHRQNLIESKLWTTEYITSDMGRQGTSYNDLRWDRHLTDHRTEEDKCSPSYPTGPYCRFLQMPTRLVFWVLTVYSLVCGYQRSGWRAETSQFGGVRCTLHPHIDSLQPWRWRRYVPPKRRWPAIMLRSVAAQRTTIRIYAAMSG